MSSQVNQQLPVAPQFKPSPKKIITSIAKTTALTAMALTAAVTACAALALAAIAIVFAVTAFGTVGGAPLGVALLLGSVAGIATACGFFHLYANLGMKALDHAEKTHHLIWG